MAKEMLHPGAKWLFRISSYFSLIILFVILSIFLFNFLSLSLLISSNSQNMLLTIPVAILTGIVFAVIIGEIYAQMAYNRWFYEFTQTGLKLERGIIWKRYSNIPYERVQNIDVTRGILARMFGFSTLNIQTAGYSAAYGRQTAMHSEGYIPAVGIEEAEQIREFLIKKISHYKHSGL